MQRYATTAVTAAAPPVAATASSIRTTPTASMPTVCTLSALNGSFAASSSRSRALRPDRAVPTGGAGFGVPVDVVTAARYLTVGPSGDELDVHLVWIERDVSGDRGDGWVRLRVSPQRVRYIHTRSAL